MESKLTLKRTDLEKIFKSDEEIIEVIELIDEEINLDILVEYKNGMAVDFTVGFSNGLGEVFENFLTLENINSL